jgi:hypothetical protein
VAGRSAPVSAKVWSNTQIRLPDNAYLGDINGDGNQDFVFARGGAVYVTNTDYGNSRLLYTLLTPGWPIARIFTGDFQGSGTDQICAIHTNGMLTCWGVSTDRTTMWWWFTMGSFIGPNEEVIVGDFNGDGAADILVYTPSTGQLRSFIIQAGFFVQNQAFSMGNIAPANLVNKQLRAGEFGQALGQTDLLVFDPTTGQVSRFDAVNYGGNPTFWWAFNTSPGFVSPSETLAVANVDGLDQDDVVLRDTSTGAYRFFRLDWNWSAGNLVPINIDPGQLPVAGGSGASAFWLRNRGSFDTSSKRDDQMFYQAASRSWTNTHARISGTTPVYWWSFIGYAVRHLDGDANGDQRTDLSVLGNPTWGTIPLATSNGDGTFDETNTANADPGMYFASWAATPGAKLLRGDFDGDGLSDLALVGGRFWGSIPVAFSNGDGSYRVTNQGVASFPAWAARPNVKAVSGDFDGDGKTDIALVGEVGRHSIAVAYSRGDGNFDVTDISAVVPANYFPDLATSRDFTHNPQVWPKVVAADFNNDGRCDLALVGGVGFTGVPVALSNGRGSFSHTYENLATYAPWASTYFLTRAQEPGTQPVAGDFDGNGFPDLALVGGSNNEQDIAIAFNFGDSQFTLTTQSFVNAPLISQWASEPGVKVVIGYFNDDALADVALVGGLGWNSIRLALSQGGTSFRATNFVNNFGSFAAEPHVWPAANVASNAGRTARSLDQDGDRRGDISLTGGTGWGSMPVALSRGDGAFKVTNNGIDPGWASFAAQPGVSVLAGDFNGDGREDVALTSTIGEPQMVAFANGNGTFYVVKRGTSLGPSTGSRVLAGDFNGDGRTDIVSIGGYANGQQAQGMIYQSNGDGSFLPFAFNQAADLAFLVNNTLCCAQIVAGDFNGDGATDLAAMGGAAGDRVWVYFANSTFPDLANIFRATNFQNATVSSQIGGSARAVVGDFDGDGLDDLYLTRGGGGSMIIGLSMGTGAFGPIAASMPNFSDWVWSFYATPVVGDFDGDGASDIALVGGQGWSSIPVALSTRRTDVGAFTIDNKPLQDFPGWAAHAGALAAAEDPTTKVDTVKVPPPQPDPPQSLPQHKDLYVAGQYITVVPYDGRPPNYLTTVNYNYGWGLEFDVCNDNDTVEVLNNPYIVVSETWTNVLWNGVEPWYIHDWWTKGKETQTDGTGIDYKDLYYVASYPPRDDTSQPGHLLEAYQLNELPAHSCHTMYVATELGHDLGAYYYEVHIGESAPLSNSTPAAAVLGIGCTDEYSGACVVIRQ